MNGGLRISDRGMSHETAWLRLFLFNPSSAPRLPQ
jgi:hypothetical protein